jgi:hypothetical protein
LYGSIRRGCERKQSNAKQSTTYVDLKEEDGAGEYAMSSPKALCMVVTPFLTLTHETALDPTVGVGVGHGGQPATTMHNHHIWFDVQDRIH